MPRKKKETKREKLPRKKKETKDVVIPGQTELTDPADIVMAEEVVSNVLSYRKGDKTGHNKYALYRLLGIPRAVAAERSGYAKSYSTKLEKRLTTDVKWQQEIARITKQLPDRYRSWARLQLPNIAEAEAGAIALMKDDPELLLKHPRLSRQLKEAGGVLETNQQAPPVVNIGFIREHIRKTLEGRDDDVIDIEPGQEDKKDK